MWVVSEIGCCSYCMVVTGNWCGQCQDRTGDVTVIMWWLQVVHVGSVRTELGMLQLLCGGYR